MAMSSLTFRANASMKMSGIFASPGVVASSTPTRNYVISQSAISGVTLAYGTGSGEVDILVCQDRTITAASSATYDLYTGTDLVDIDNVTAPLRKVKFAGVYIITGGDSSGVAVGGAAVNPWAAFFANASDIHNIFPSGPPYQGGSPAGVVVSSPGSLNWKIANLGAVDVTVRLIICGTSV